jgi:hypothetical protein
MRRADTSIEEPSVRVHDPDHFTTPTLVQANRRGSARLPADRLRWLERVRLAYGPAVSLIDLSVTGAYFEVGAPLKPGDSTKIELVAADQRMVVTGHILRTEVSGLRADSIRYRGACAFTRPLPWDRRLKWSAVPPDPIVVEPTGYEPWSGWSEAHLTFRHGRVLRGFTRGFRGSQSVIDLWPSRTASARERQIVPLSLLRTIFIARDLEDDGGARRNDRADVGSMHPVEVTFRNNEFLLGATPGYGDGQVGLWVLPLQRGDPTRVFAVASAVRDIRLF